MLVALDLTHCPARLIDKRKKKYTLKNLVLKIRFRSEISLLNSENSATNFLLMGHFSLFRSAFLLVTQFSILNFIACSLLT